MSKKIETLAFSILKIYTKAKSKAIAYCPSKNCKDKEPKLHIKANNEVAFCFKCSTTYLNTEVNKAIVKPIDLKERLTELKIKVDNNLIDYATMFFNLPIAKDSTNKVHDYLLQRCNAIYGLVSKEIVCKWFESLGLKYCPLNNGCVVVPFKTKNKIIYYQQRLIVPQKGGKLKYLMPETKEYAKPIYYLPSKNKDSNNSKYLFIVEGVFDALALGFIDEFKLHSLLPFNVEHNIATIDVIAVLGKTISKEQMGQIKQLGAYDSIIFMLDKYTLSRSLLKNSEYHLHTNSIYKPKLMQFYYESNKADPMLDLEEYLRIKKKM